MTLQYQIIQGDNAETLKQFSDNHFDSIITDPPYGIEFLGKDWDKHTGTMETWNECLRVLKPGGHILAFSAARTYHNLASNIEAAGFEIRDQIMWLYGSGFPKAQDMGKKVEGYEGWKTALKPAHEPIVLARKPFKGSCIDNVQEWGTGAMNIDASRVTYNDEQELNDYIKRIEKYPDKMGSASAYFSEGKKEDLTIEDKQQGRYPANVIMDEEAGAMLDKQAPKVGNAAKAKRTKTGMTGSGNSLSWHKEAGEDNGFYDGLSGASKFFYSPKVSKAERNIGDAGNNHPTVKPVELMKYLITLVTPKGGKVLDPFNGSGSTGMAAVELGHEYTGCELDEAYVEIAKTRIEAWYEETKPKNNFGELFGEE